MDFDRLLCKTWWEIKAYKEDPTDDRLEELLFTFYNEGYEEGLYADD